MSTNPFSIVSPEELTAQQAEQLFVELYSDFPEITRSGNTLIFGARGCGKSMMIRCSMPDVLMAKDSKQKRFEELPYLAFSIPIKKTSLDLQELRKLDDRNAPFMINEHFFSLHVLMFIFHELAGFRFSENLYDEKAYRAFFDNYFMRYLKASGYAKTCNSIDYASSNSFFNSLYEELFVMVCEFVPYLKRIVSSTDTDFSYNQPVLSYLRFIVPIVNELCKLPDFPHEKPVFLFIDDADNLSLIQTQILNSWLACRTQPKISIKVSSQIGLYKTFLTSSGVLVESPHDYQEVNISYLYTTKNNDFYGKAKEIIDKRLKNDGIEISPDNFFPPDIEQEKRINAEKERIKSEYLDKGRGYRVDDDVRRYAIPNYIKNLGGTRKSRSTYKYAGLDNIIHLSSGIIRYLLDAAAMMFDRESNDDKKKSGFSYIEPSTQNNVMRDKANFYLFNELRKGNNTDSFDSPIAISDSPTSVTDKLGNLINAMGKTFHEILVSNRSERKVFSIALTNNPDKEIKEVLDLGVRLGFLHESYIGNKEGNGRTLLYVLNRCFAPVFTLDPTGFQGYFFMTNEDLRSAIRTGKQLRRINNELTVEQLSFDDIWDEV